jgi:hypothetical protein
MKASKRELREEWAERVWLTLEFWMLRARVSRRDFDVDTLEEVVSQLRNIPTFKAYRKAVTRRPQRHGQRTYVYAATSFPAPLSARVQAHTLHLRRLLAQWRRESLSRTEPE